MMNFLQTIWMALTTPNDLLIKLVIIPLTFIEIFVTMLLFTTILNISITKKQKFTYVIVFSIIAIITNYFIPSPYNIFINIALFPVLVIILFKITILKAFIAEIIQYISSIVIGFLVLIAYTNFLKISTEVALSIPIHKISYCLIVYACIYCLSKLFTYFNLSIKLSPKIKRVNNLVLLINIIVGIIVFSIEWSVLSFYNDNLSPILKLSSIVPLLAYFFISIYSLSRTTKLEITTESLEEQKLCNKTLTILHDSIRGFKHDFSNIVQAIGGYIATNDLNGLKKYYSELLDDCQRVNNLSILNPEIINNPPIYSILTSKYYIADELGIKINLEVFLDLNTLNMKIYEFTKILGILLDNAIEASKKCEEKVINIIIRKDTSSKRQLVIIENTYIDKDVNIDKIFEKGYTSKSGDDTRNHGIGLWEVRQILKKNDNLNLYTIKDDKFFKQQLEIYL